MLRRDLKISIATKAANSSPSHSSLCPRRCSYAISTARVIGMRSYIKCAAIMARTISSAAALSDGEADSSTFVLCSNIMASSTVDRLLAPNPFPRQWFSRTQSHKHFFKAQLISSKHALQHLVKCNMVPISVELALIQPLLPEQRALWSAPIISVLACVNFDILRLDGGSLRSS
jgi:hypothetical protein